MSGSKFSTSRGKVIYVGDFLRDFGPDALRYFIAVAGPETTDADFTWDEFVRRTNFELANEWGNLVNRSLSMAHKNNGSIPSRARCWTSITSCSTASAPLSTPSATLFGRNRFKQAIGEAMRVVGAANKYISDTEPWKLKDDPDRRDTVLHTALQVVSDANTLLTPFLPHAAQQVTRPWAATGSGRPARDPRSERGRRLRTIRSSWATTPPSRRPGRPGRSLPARRWSSRPRCSPSSTRSWVRPDLTGHRSRPDWHPR